MTIKEVIQKAEEGGFPNHEILMLPNVFLSSEFWMSLGKAMEWVDVCSNCHYSRGAHQEMETPDHRTWFNSPPCGRSSKFVPNDWKAHWHRFIDSLAEGKPPEQFFESLQ